MYIFNTDISRLVLFLFLSVLLMSNNAFAGDDDCDADLVKWLNCNNPRVKAYLTKLISSDIGKKLEGIELTDGTLTLSGATYLGRVKNVPKGVHLYIFEENSNRIAYLWVDEGADEFLLPTCPEIGLPESAHVLSGDIYTWKLAQPTGDLIQVDCVYKTWKPE